jgi:peptidoglycan-N-acetylglucosamine deacetylase
MSRKLTASLSLDLDNQWSYMKTHGDAGWEALPSYLDIVVPRVLKFLRERNLKITWFIVGLDAAKAADRDVLRRITDEGHEVGNHSYNHEPWLHLYQEAEIEAELAKTEDAIFEATGQRPTGFRGPGFSLSPTVLQVLARRGYRYDASTFPTFLGPLARMYYFATSKGFTAEEKKQRAQLFGKLSEGFRPLRPYRWSTPTGPILEIPVTTMPVFKVPVHVSYLLYLACYSRRLALAYWSVALGMCRRTGTELSLLLHPLDFLGGDDVKALDFFPAMKLPGQRKVQLLGEFFDSLTHSFDCVPMGEHARRIEARGGLRTLRPG